MMLKQLKNSKVCIVFDPVERISRYPALVLMHETRTNQ